MITLLFEKFGRPKVNMPFWVLTNCDGMYIYKVGAGGYTSALARRSLVGPGRARYGHERTDTRADSPHICFGAYNTTIRGHFRLQQPYFSEKFSDPKSEHGSRDPEI